MDISTRDHSSVEIHSNVNLVGAIDENATYNETVPAFFAVFVVENILTKVLR